MPVGDCALRGLSNFEMAVYKGVNLKSMESDPIDFSYGAMPVGYCALRGLCNFEMAVYKGVNLKPMESDSIDLPLI